MAQNFERTLNRGTSGQKQSVICAKVVVVSTVSVTGLGSHTGVGEEWADDENSATRAEAQAFKRACSCFGLGRYLQFSLSNLSAFLIGVGIASSAAWAAAVWSAIIMLERGCLPSGKYTAGRTGFSRP